MGCRLYRNKLLIGGKPRHGFVRSINKLCHVCCPNESKMTLIILKQVYIYPCTFHGIYNDIGVHLGVDKVRLKFKLASEKWLK